MSGFDSMVSKVAAIMNKQQYLDAPDDQKILRDLENSDKYRAEGNQLFVKGNLLTAIAQYNKALVLARNDPRRASLCYGNRSAAFLELEFFQHCLHNIELAEPNFPAEKIQRLRDRREKCLELMKTRLDKGIKVFDHNFSLSYEANSKLPFFIDALELKENSSYGKHLITKIDLKAGDVIAVMDKPWRAPVSNLDANYNIGCYQCSDTNNGDLMPGKCQALFCSKECMDLHDCEKMSHKDFVEIETLPYVAGESTTRPSFSLFKFIGRLIDIFGSVAEMRKYVEQHSNKDYTVFDFDWRGIDEETRYKYTLLAMMNAKDAAPKSGGRRSAKAHEILDLFVSDDNKFLQLFSDLDHREFLDKLWGRLQTHWFSLETMIDPTCKIALLTHAAMKLFLHVDCCDPNIVVNSNRRDLIITVLHPIKAGSMLRKSSNSYYRGGDGEMRICLKKPFETCEPCKNGWKRQFGGAIEEECAEDSISFFACNDPALIASQIEHVKQCSDFINENYHAYSTDAKLRRMIAKRLFNLQSTLLNIGNPFAYSNAAATMLSFRRAGPVAGMEMTKRYLKISCFKGMATPLPPQLHLN